MSNRSIAVFRLFSFLGVILTGVGAWLFWDWYDCLPRGLKAEYVGRDSCIRCHQQQYAQWQGSDHDLAMDHANDETVLADFNNTTFEKEGVTSRFFKKDGKFFVHTRGREGAMETFELKYTFGIRPLQQYLAQFPDGKLQALPIAWDVEKKQWFDVSEDDHIQPDEPVYWTNRAMNWNAMCAECHSTNLQKNFEPESGSYHTTWSEIDVSCEACHGPGSIHEQVVAKWSLFPDRRYGTGLAPLKSADSQIQIDTCGRCHSRKQHAFPGFEPGDRFVDHFIPEMLDSQAYYPDGQIKEENYVYSSFHLSLMYQKGVRCTDCHDPHTTKIYTQGNNLCIRCHVAGKYDTPTHHFHQPGSTGSLCVECHMPETTYMKVDPRRDHSFRIPRPDLTLSLQIPNACNRCHDDKPAEWSQDHVVKWYGEKKSRPRRIDFAETIAAGREMKPEAIPGLTSLVHDPDAPALLRASALSLLGMYPPGDKQRTSLFTSFASHTDPLLRRVAVRNLGMTLDGRGNVGADRDRVALLAESLSDESPPIRHEAARALASVDPSFIDRDKQPQLQKELQSYIDLMLSLSDDPGPNLHLGALYQDLNDPQRAEQYYLRALERDPSFNPARFNLGLFYSLQGDRDKAIATYQQALEWEEKLKARGFTDPRIIERNRFLLREAHYSLGLLLAEEPEQLPEAIVHLEKTVEIDPSHPRAQYNLGLAYKHLGKEDEAFKHLRAAYELQPKADDITQALAEAYYRKGNLDVTLKLLRSIVERNPARLDLMNFIQHLEQQMKSSGS